ncbi:hypothetical protein C8J57DRAFT_1486788 [Mycena rebaudengoi]|nr:hypothetical protein C8J57DRAFT_1486788 [Mycena rebaudengoi]
MSWNRVLSRQSADDGEYPKHMAEKEKEYSLSSLQFLKEMGKISIKDGGEKKEERREWEEREEGGEATQTSKSGRRFCSSDVDTHSSRRMRRKKKGMQGRVRSHVSGDTVGRGAAGEQRGEERGGRDNIHITSIYDSEKESGGWIGRGNRRGKRGSWIIDGGKLGGAAFNGVGYWRNEQDWSSLAMWAVTIKTRTKSVEKY